MNTEFTRKVLEAALLAAGRSLSLSELQLLFDMVDRPDNTQLREALDELAGTYNGRGIELIETAAGFRTNYMTALHAFRQRAALQAGETVLVLGAAGGVDGVQERRPDTGGRDRHGKRRCGKPAAVAEDLSEIGRAHV